MRADHATHRGRAVRTRRGGRSRQQPRKFAASENRPSESARCEDTPKRGDECLRCKTLGHWAEDCDLPMSPSRIACKACDHRGSTSRACGNCGKDLHLGIGIAETLEAYGPRIAQAEEAVAEVWGETNEPQAFQQLKKLESELEALRGMMPPECMGPRVRRAAFFSTK